MATTPMLSTDALAVKRWEIQTYLEMIQRTVIGHMMNRGTIFFADDFIGDNRAARGDELTYAFAGNHTNVPVGEGGTLNNNTEALNLQNNTVAMNVSRFGFESPNRDTIEQQRTTVQFDDTSISQLAKKARILFEYSAFFQLAGADPNSVTLEGTTYSGATEKTHIQGHNSTVDPTDERIVRAGGAATDQALTASDTMSLDQVDAAVELAETSTQAIERLDDDGFDLFVHPFQMIDIKRDNSTGIQWYTNQQAEVAGGELDDNYLKKSLMNNMLCAGTYNDTKIYGALRVAPGVDSSDDSVITTVRRAVLCGKNAAVYASPYGGRLSDTDVPVKFFYQYKDFDYFKAVECRLIYGLKKQTFTNEQDYGSIVISTYADSHA